MAGHQCVRRLQRDVSVPAGRARRLRRQGRARAAAARPVPHRVRGPDLARESRPAAAGEPLLRDSGEGRRVAGFADRTGPPALTTTDFRFWTFLKGRRGPETYVVRGRT